MSYDGAAETMPDIAPRRWPATPGPARLVTLLGFLIVMVDGYDSLMVSFLAPLLAREWHLTASSIGLLFTAGYAGAVLGAGAGGALADRIGRKPALLASLALTGLCTGACAWAGSYGELLAFRVVAGMALGGVLPAVIALTAEHAPPARRAGTVTTMYVGYPLGAVVGGLLTTVFLQHGWRSVFLAAGGASLVVLAAACLLPESPAVFRNPGAARFRSLAVSLREQFADGRRVPALLLWAGLFCTLLLTYFLVSWTPSILVSAGVSVKGAALGGLLLNLGGVVGALLSVPLVNRRGPYLTVGLMAASGAVLIAVLGLAVRSSALAMAMLFLIGACAIGGQLSFPAMTVQLFPPRVRGAGTGWTIGVGRLGSIAGPLIGGGLIAAGLGQGALFAMGAIPACLAAGTVLLASRSLPRGSVKLAGDAA